MHSRGHTMHKPGSACIHCLDAYVTSSSSYARMHTHIHKSEPACIHCTDWTHLCISMYENNRLVHCYEIVCECMCVHTYAIHTYTHTSNTCSFERLEQQACPSVYVCMHSCMYTHIHYTHAAPKDSRDQVGTRVVSSRPNQRIYGIRGSGSAGHICGYKRGSGACMYVSMHACMYVYEQAQARSVRIRV
jgi:hypothetical protein